jgi:membrane-associated phospholipid phosphatase
MVNVGRSLNAGLYDRTYSVLGDPNPVAAMPSLHEAITFIVFLFLTRFGWKWGLVGFAYAVAMAFSLAYTGEHYIIDTLVGAAIATYAFYFSGFWLRMTAPIFDLIERRASSSRQAATPANRVPA